MTDAEALILIRDVVASLAPDKAAALAAVGVDDSLDGLGIDSVLTLEVVGLLEERLETTFPDDRLASLHSVRGLVELVRRHGPPAAGRR